MLQIIEEQRKPSFGQQLAQGLSQGIYEASQGVPRIMGERLKGKKLEEEKNKENEAAKRFGVDLSDIKDPEIRKIIMSESLKGQTKQMEAQQKAAQEQQKLDQEKQGIADSLDWLDENIKYTGSTNIPFTASNTYGKLNREAIQKREEFTKTGFWATDKIYTHFNKGQISNQKLEMIKNDLAPNADLTERENKARIAALRRVGNLPKDAPKSVIDKVINREVKAIKKIEKRSKAEVLTDEEIQTLIDEFGGDWQAAEKTAQERGYKW